MIHASPALGALDPAQLAAISQRARRLGATDVYLDPDPADPDGILARYTRRRPFERIRRITGYLVGDTARWNSAKLAELHDRVTHA
jgi:hypothetical protein